MSFAWRFRSGCVLVTAIVGKTVPSVHCLVDDGSEEPTTMTNWCDHHRSGLREKLTPQDRSRTKHVTTGSYLEPESIEELVEIVATANQQRRRIRPVGTRRPLRCALCAFGIRRVCAGSALSPNGLGFSEGGMINMIQCDQILNVDVERQQVTVCAGARVSQVTWRVF